jgi:hypothetical protein
MFLQIVELLAQKKGWGRWRSSRELTCMHL